MQRYDRDKSQRVPDTDPIDDGVHKLTALTRFKLISSQAEAFVQEETRRVAVTWANSCKLEDRHIKRSKNQQFSEHHELSVV